jgi:putative transposase
MAAACIEHGLEVWAWCLMPDHVHRVVVPEAPESLALGIGRAHWRYTRTIRCRENWRGYLWQGRFSSCPMDGPHTPAAARYVERNPVRAGLVAQAWDRPWSSAAAHPAGRGDRLVKAGGPPAAQVPDGRAFLVTEDDEEMLRRLRRHGRTGRPLGSPGLVTDLEQRLSRPLSPPETGAEAGKEEIRSMSPEFPQINGSTMLLQWYDRWYLDLEAGTWSATKP